VSIALGNGDGTFGSAVNISLQGSCKGLAVGDLNGDGKPDLVATTYSNSSSPGQVAVLLGNGDGTFKSPNYVTVGFSPYGVAIADLNGDGKPDLAVANYLDHTLSILTGNGDGTFAAGATLATGLGPTEVRVADLNGDGKPDLVNANDYGSSVSVFLGNGDGTFQAAETLFTYGLYSRAVAVADVNGDGKPDVMATTAHAAVSLFLGNGDGTFQNARTFATDEGSEWRIIVADLNQDGKPDLVVGAGFGAVSVLPGNGDGTFQDQQTYFLPGSGAGFPDLAAAEINGDGKPDLLLTDRYNDRVGILIHSDTEQYGFQAPASTVAGKAFSLTVTAETATGQVDPHVGTVQFTSGNPNAVLPADYTFTAADQGVHTFAGVVLKTKGSWTITAADTVSTLVKATAPVTVYAAAVNRFGIFAPRNVTAGVSFSVTVTALDAFRNVTSLYRGTVHFTSTDAQAVLPADYTFTAADNGRHTFTVTLNTAGSQTITVTDTTHTGVTGHATVSVAAIASVPADGLGEWLAPALDAFFSRWPVRERGVFIGGH
jgi:hypothetical protein